SSSSSPPPRPTLCPYTTLFRSGKSLAFRNRLLAALGYAIGCMAIFATFSRQAFLIIGTTTLLLALRRNPLVAVIAVAGMLAYPLDRKSTRLNSSHVKISYAVFC